MSNKANSQSKLKRFMKAPIKVLCMVRDLYVRSVIDCAGTISYGSAMGCPASSTSNLPKNFSTNSSRSKDEDLKELIRAASQRNQVDTEIRQQKSSSVLTSNALPRSFTVGIGRIDEDKPCDFEDVKGKPQFLYPKSKSYGVSNRTNVLL